MKNLKVLGLASLTAVCAFSLVSCGNTYHEKEKAAKEYMVAHPEQYGQFDLSGGKFSWELSTSAVAHGCQYEISYNFKTDKGTLYVKDLTAKELTEFEATFTLTYDWDYDEAADTEKVGPWNYEIKKVKKGSESMLDKTSEDFAPGIYYGEMLAVSYKLQGTAFIAVETAYALATAAE